MNPPSVWSVYLELRTWNVLKPGDSVSNEIDSSLLTYARESMEAGVVFAVRGQNDAKMKKASLPQMMA